MKTEHEGIEITYGESKNDWSFVLRGRRRSVESLAKAREAIDKEPAEKRAPFPKFDAYMVEYSGFKVVSVTSIAEDSYYKGASFWVNDGDRRRKERDENLFIVNEHNQEVMRSILLKEKAKSELHDEQSALRKTLQKVAIPDGFK